MKKLLFFISMVLFTASVFAQGIYLRAGGGYGLPAATSKLGEKYIHAYTYNGTSSTNTYSNEIISGSYGSGGNFSVSAGYEINRNFLIDLNVQYLIGRKYETGNIYTEKDVTYSGSDKQVFTTSSKGFYFNPALVFSVGFGKAAPYGRLGVLAASPRIIRDEYNYYDLDGTDTRNIRWEYHKGLALGYQVGLGFNWKLTEMLDFYTEAGFVSMTYYAKEGEMTQYTQDGTDVLNQLSVAQKQILFKKKYDPNLSYDAAKPSIAGREASPLSSINAQAGIRFLIWRKAE